MNGLIGLFSVEEITRVAVTYSPRVLAAIIMMAVFWGGYRLSRRPLRVVLVRSGMDENLVNLLVDNVYRFTLMIFGLVMALSQLGVNVAAALAGIGVAGLAIGLAAQDSLANTIAGFTIFWDKPFAVGDFVTVQDRYGKVAEITLRTTRIQTNQNTYVVIPNKVIVDAILVNHTKHGVTRVDVPIGIAYKESIPEAREVLLAAVRRVDGVARQPGPSVVVDALGASSVNLLVRVWIDDAAGEQSVHFAAIEAAKLALDEAGIQIPFPHLQLFVDDVEDRVWQGAARLVGSSREG